MGNKWGLIHNQTGHGIYYVLHSDTGNPAQKVMDTADKMTLE